MSDKVQLFCKFFFIWEWKYAKFKCCFCATREREEDEENSFNLSWFKSLPLAFVTFFFSLFWTGFCTLILFLWTLLLLNVIKILKLEEQTRRPGRSTQWCFLRCWSIRGYLQEFQNERHLGIDIRALHTSGLFRREHALLRLKWTAVGSDESFHDRRKR